jgi:hypothetical protein
VEVIVDSEHHAPITPHIIPPPRKAKKEVQPQDASGTKKKAMKRHIQEQIPKKLPIPV